MIPAPTRQLAWASTQVSAVSGVYVWILQYVADFRNIRIKNVTILKCFLIYTLEEFVLLKWCCCCLLCDKCIKDLYINIYICIYFNLAQSGQVCILIHRLDKYFNKNSWMSRRRCRLKLALVVYEILTIRLRFKPCRKLLLNTYLDIKLQNQYCIWSIQSIYHQCHQSINPPIFRFVLFTYPLQHSDGRSSNPLCFLFSSPR